MPAAGVATTATESEVGGTQEGNAKLDGAPALLILYFGKVGPFSGRHQGSVADPRVIEFTAPILRRRVIEPNRALGWTVDVAGHTWDTQMAPTIREHFDLVGEDFVPWPDRDDTRQFCGVGGCFSGGQFFSYERAMRLLLKVEEQRGAPYDLVLLLRWDVVYFSDFIVDGLDRDVIYAANWCRATGDEQVIDGRRCRNVEFFYGDATKGLPDFWFLGPSKHLNPVFSHLWTPLQESQLKPYGIYGAHGLIPARIDELNIPIGRYLNHHLDFDFIREVNDGRMQCTEQGLHWLQGPHKAQISRLSLCDGLTYCACDAAQLTLRAFNPVP